MFIPEIGKKIRVTVPSTTANLGPGFDCLGAALDLHNEFIFSRIVFWRVVMDFWRNSIKTFQKL